MKCILLISFLCCNSFIHAQSGDDYAQQIKDMEAMEAKKQAAIPKENIARHIQTVTTSPAIIAALATACKQSSFAKIDAATKPQLATILAGKNSLADMGVTYFISGPKGMSPAYYLISNAILKNPKDTLAINDLGILLKNDGQYEKAYQCFKYADQLFANSSIFKTNLGWTAAYYGDFASATKFFNDAIAIEPTNAGTLEGLCTLAAAKGDYQSLMQHLFKRMQLGGAGTGAPLPSSQMVDLLDDAYHNSPELRKQDPFTDHTFDTPLDAADENTDQPSAATANSETPDYPSFGAFFFIDPITIDKKLDMIKQGYKSIKKDEQAKEDEVTALFAALPPLSKPSYKDDHGDVITPKSYEKEFKFFDMITVQFLKRDNWIHLQDLKATMKMDPYTAQAMAWTHKIPGDPDAREKFICQSADDNLSAAKEKLLGDYQKFSNTWKKVVDNINWYVAATTPYIKKVHDPKLNEYLNKKREAHVRLAAVTQLGAWLNSCIGISNAINEQMVVRQDCLNKNMTTLNVMGNGDVKIKKLKTWPERCDVPTGDYGSSKYGATLHMTCDELKVSLGMGVKVNYETKFGKDETQDVTKISISGGTDKSGSHDINIGGHKVGEAGLGGELNADGFIVLQNGKVTDFGVEATGSLTGEIGIKTGNDKLDKYMPSGSVSIGGNARLSLQTGLKGSFDPVSTSTSNIPTGQ